MKRIVLLSLAALMLGGIFAGVAIGTLAALRHNGPADRIAMAVAMTGISIPNFVMAPLLILVFAIYLGWLPAGGLGEGSPSHLVLPVIALALPQIAYITRLTRASMIDVLSSGFVRTARAQGLGTVIGMTHLPGHVLGAQSQAAGLGTDLEVKLAFSG